MNIRPRAGETRDLDNQSFPNSGPFRKSLFLAAGMLVPAPDRRAALAQPRNTRAMPCASRREAVFAAVEAYNRTHPAAPLPRPAARLLAVMFADRGCLLPEPASPGGRGVRQDPARGAARPGRGGLRVEAGGYVTVPDTYRLLALAEVP